MSTGKDDDIELKIFTSIMMDLESRLNLLLILEGEDEKVLLKETKSVIGQWFGLIKKFSAHPQMARARIFSISMDIAQYGDTETIGWFLPRLEKEISGMPWGANIGKVHEKAVLLMWNRICERPEEYINHVMRRKKFREALTHGFDPVQKSGQDRDKGAMSGILSGIIAGVEKDNVDCVKYLVGNRSLEKKGICINHDADGHLILKTAIKYGAGKVIDYLLGESKSYTKDQLIEMSRDGTFESMDILPRTGKTKDAALKEVIGLAQDIEERDKLMAVMNDSGTESNQKRKKMIV